MLLLSHTITALHNVLCMYGCVYVDVDASCAGVGEKGGEGGPCMHSCADVCMDTNARGVWRDAINSASL